MGKINNWLFVIVLLAVNNTSGQTLRRPIAASYTGLGAYSTNHADVFSFTANQASLAQLKNTAVAVYGERRFLLAELNNYTAAAAVLTSSGNFGLKAMYSGFTDYNETQLGIAYGRKLGNKVDIGAQFNYNGISVSGYGNATAISFELGTVLHITDRLHAGVHVNNPVGGKFGKTQEEKLSSVYTAGFGYEASEKFFVSIELQKEENQPINVNGGMQYKFIPQLLARVGVSSATSSGWLGIGLMLQSFRLDITTSYHQQLGLTPGLLLLYNFNNNRN
ncbi:hypothetical protein CAP36_05200 [Chitinophagaceae bacterium IBVUCB2]|nr:hypothetical protein CAP36_05200 [Chitinophagaceae bacterium IBVUCB2]